MNTQENEGRNEKYLYFGMWKLQNYKENATKISYLSLTRTSLGKVYVLFCNCLLNRLVILYKNKECNLKNKI